MTEANSDCPPLRHSTLLAPPQETAVILPPPTTVLTLEGEAALAVAQAIARNASAPATLRADRADWPHFPAGCTAKGFVPVPAAREVVGPSLASLAETHSPATIRRRLSALGKMHRYNDLPW